MIRKRIFSGDQEELFKAAGGLTCRLLDPDAMFKSASDAFPARVVEDLKPPPGHFLVHYIGIGAHEKYGWNRNGDTFKEATLKRDTPTFLKGHYFREHNNRDPKRKIGDIKAAAYNPEMSRTELLVWGDRDKAGREYEMAKQGKELHSSMSCFPAGTGVRMASGEWRNIEEVVVGDKVVTHKGNVGVVSDVQKNRVDETGVVIRPYGTAFDVVCTGDHGIWTRKTQSVHQCPVCGGVYKNLNAHLWQKHDAQHRAAYESLGKATEGFWPADSLLPGDEIRISFDTSVDSVPDENYAKVLGWYVAEGSVFMPEGDFTVWAVDWTLNIEEKTVSKNLRKWLLALGVDEKRISIYEEPKGGRIRVRCRDVGMISKLRRDGGKLAIGKRLSDDVMRWRPREQKLLLEKWLEGDGSWHKGTSNFLTGVTVSRELAEQMQKIAWRCGIAEAFVGRCRSKQGGRIKGKEVKTRAEWTYTTTFRSRALGKLNVSKIPDDWVYREYNQRPIGQLRHQAAGRVVKQRVSAPERIRIENGFAYVKIRKIERRMLSCDVYDFTVPGDHGFVVDGGFGVSNCRVPHDVCSICGNRAPTRAQYCDHARNHLNQYLPEFRKYAYVDNPKCDFFDLSDVLKPADRIAHALKIRFPDEELRKAAAEDGAAISGAEWAELMGDPQWDPYDEALLRKLAAEEAWLAGLDYSGTGGGVKEAFARNTLPYAFDGELPQKTIDAMRDLRPGTMFRELAKRAVLLPFRSFVSLVDGRPLDDPAPEVKTASAFLPGLFRSMAETPRMLSLAPLFRAESQEAADMDCANTDPVQRLMDEAEERFSIGLAPTKPRSIRITLVKLGSRKLLEPIHPGAFATPDGRAESLLYSYGAYKIAALRDMDAILGQRHPLEITLAAGQHLIGG